MSEFRFVLHIDVLTAETHRSARTDVDDATVVRLRKFFEGLHDGDRPRLPGMEATVRMRASGRCATARIYAPDGVAVASIAVGGHARCASKHWEQLHLDSELDLATLGQKAPSTPWCVVVAERGRDKHPALFESLESLAPAFAWAWLERGRGA